VLRGLMSAETDQLRNAIESQHGGTAMLAQSVPVKETHARSCGPSRGLPGLCLVVPNRGRRHQGPVKSPVDAVRAAIVAEHGLPDRARKETE
jgi:hypothetical protein